MKQLMLDLATAFATFPVLHTRRCVLRAATPNDAVDMFRIMHDPQVVRYFGQPPMSKIDDALARIGRFGTSFTEHTGIRWAIIHRDHDRLIGTCGFWRLIKPHFRAEIGYELAPEWWGQGIMTEVIGAALQFGFEQMKLHSVEAQIHPANLGSRRVLEKLGFVQEGYFRENYFDPINSCFTNTAVFSLLQIAWTERQPAELRAST